MRRIDDMKTEAINIQLPDTLARELDLIPETGLYKSKSEFLVEAIKTLLAVRKDLRIAVACRLYAKGKASLGGACRIADVDIETMKFALADHGIERVSDADMKDLEKMDQISIRFSKRG